MELFGIAIIILTGVLIYLTWWNGRWVKQSHQDATALLDRREKRQKETSREVAEAREEVARAFAEARRDS